MPESLGIDAAGILYVGDEHNHRVRRISHDGVITTVAGTGTAGFDGDGKQATETQLNDPEYVFLRADGSMLIADGDNGRVRLVTADGVVRSIAGRDREPYAPWWSGKRP
jgi:serine/threonine-protein kinase